MSDTIKVRFKMANQQNTEEYTFNRNKTVESMITKYLEDKGKILDLNDYTFMVRATPLDKLNLLSKQIKHCKQITPNCIISVKYVGQKKGGNN